jgi:hypothetical protein
MPTYIYYALIPHPSQVRVLLLEEDGTWRLPVVQGHAHYSDSAEFIRRHFGQRLGIDLTVLRWVDYTYQAGSETFGFFYALENHSPRGQAPPSAGWFAPHELDRVALENVEQRSIVKAWLTELESAAHNVLRSPWAVPGWLAEAQAWISTQLDRLGMTRAGEMEQVKVWQRSCVLRVPTNSGPVYFKAVPDGFRVELSVLLELARTDPAYARLILASDLKRCWFLMADLGGPSLFEVPDLGHWENAVRAYAQIQIDHISRTSELGELGCMDRRLERLPEMLDSLLATGLCMQAGIPGALTDVERGEMERLLPVLKGDSRRLMAFDIPYTLEHGDLNPKNLIVREDAYIIFDWSDCSISHPFFSLRPLFGLLDRVFSDPSGVRAKLRDVYLDEWAKVGAWADLVAAFELADKLAPLHMALSFHVHVLPSLEVKSEWIGTEALFLRWLLAQYGGRD